MANGNVQLPLWGVIIIVIVTAISFMANGIQGAALTQMEDIKAKTQDQEVRIRDNTQALTELRYIRQQLDRIEGQLQQIREEQ